jgi:aspartyl-tRNA(Asn)/glutamyl-tRNA(Gln) amidotransferase subunit A
MRDADVVHLPMLPFPVPTIAETTEGSPADVARAIAAVTHCPRALNYLGLPVVAVPCGFSANRLPIGFQLVGRPFDEATLLRVADAYQRDTPWHAALPPAAELTS